MLPSNISAARRGLAAALLAPLLFAIAPLAFAQGMAVPPRPLKAVVVTMFGPEAEGWVAPLTLDRAIPVPGLAPDYPAIRCNADDVCLLTTSMGHANAAASTLALALDPRFDLTRTYFLAAGIAHEIDAREMPTGWRSGYYGLLTQGPGEKPKFVYRTEAARLDEALLQKALALTRGTPLQDSDTAKRYRAKYRKPAARGTPAVTQCDTLGGDTWWHGHRLGAHARAWTKLMSNGEANYCTTQQEDNATYNALERAAAAGRVDLKRLAVLHAGANFDRPAPGQSAHASLTASHSGQTGGFVPALQNLQAVGGLLVRDIVAHWPRWREGVKACRRPDGNHPSRRETHQPQAAHGSQCRLVYTTRWRLRAVTPRRPAHAPPAAAALCPPPPAHGTTLAQDAPELDQATVTAARRLPRTSRTCRIRCRRSPSSGSRKAASAWAPAATACSTPKARSTRR